MYFRTAQYSVLQNCMLNITSEALYDFKEETLYYQLLQKFNKLEIMGLNSTHR